MIVNLKYLKKPWSEFPALGISSFRVMNLDLRKTLYMVTALQLWIQSFSIFLLANSYLLEWYIGKGGKLSNYLWIGYGQFYYNTSLVFQICDIILSMYASYYLRNAMIRYNSLQDVRIWIIFNNIYLLTAFACFPFVLSKVGILIICIKTMIVLIFANYKIYIVRQIYKDEKSSYIFLEQGPPLLTDSPKSVNEDYLPPQNYAVVEVKEESTEKVTFEPLLYAANN